MSAPVSQNQNKVKTVDQSILKFKEEPGMKRAMQITKVKMVMSRALATQHPVKLVGILALGALLVAGIAVQFAPESNKESDDRPSVAKVETIVKSNNSDSILLDETLLWMKPWTKPQVPALVVARLAQVRPWQEPGINVQARQAAQRELIELGLATMEGEQFQASVAEADDAGHGKLLLQAGFTGQQIRNAQEYQREADEEDKAKVWFQQLVSISALAELRRQGFADFQGKVNVAAADDAGYGNLLLHAGFTELQIQDAQERQRQAHEEAEADAWFRQLAEIQERGLPVSKR
jgi:hypothetical protein